MIMFYSSPVWLGIAAVGDCWPSCRSFGHAGVVGVSPVSSSV